MPTGNEFILVITNETERITRIKNDRKTIPNDLKFDFKLRTCLVEIIREANIQNWVKKITGITNSGTTAKNLSKPGACAYPTDISIFLNGIFASLSGKILTPIT